MSESDSQPPRGPTRGLRHSAFFIAAGQQPGGSPAFEMLSAALLVLRLLDRWFGRATTGRDVEFKELVAVLGKVESLSDGPIRRVLAGLLDTVGGNRSVRASQLLTLAQLLEEDSYWEPAADVYQMAIERIAYRLLDRELLPLCYDRRGYCFRQVGRMDDALRAYNEGIAIARDLADTSWTLRLRIHHAIVEFQKGNLPEAELQLDIIIEDAEEAHLPDLIARAVHERGQVAYARNEDELAAELFYRAVQTHVDPYLTRRAELDLAVALSDLGHIEYARTVCEIVRARPDHAGMDSKQLAGINLMRLAHLRADRPGFDQLREELSVERMSGRLRAYYHLTVGQGLQRFGDVDQARAAFQETIEVAQTFRVYQLVIRAEKLLRASDKEQPKPLRIPRVTETLAPIFAAIDHRQGPFTEAAL